MWHFTLFAKVLHLTMIDIVQLKLTHLVRKRVEIITSVFISYSVLYKLQTDFSHIVMGRNLNPSAYIRFDLGFKNLMDGLFWADYCFKWVRMGKFKCKE